MGAEAEPSAAESYRLLQGQAMQSHHREIITQIQ
jgi:hypothetical protein